MACLRIFFFFLIFLCMCQNGHSKRYYFDSQKGSDKNSGSIDAPWESLERIKSLSLKPGDSILFARGTSFEGGFVLEKGGTVEKPVYITAYGKGNAPEFTSSDYTSLNGNVIQVRASYVIIDGLKFVNTSDCSFKEVVKPENYWKDEALRTRIDKKVLLAGAIFQQSEAKYLTVKNCEFENCPIAVNITGQYNLITKNNFHDCNRALWEPLWGPLALVISNAHNEISYNKCTNYVYKGGLLELTAGLLN